MAISLAILSGCLFASTGCATLTHAAGAATSGGDAPAPAPAFLAAEGPDSAAITTATFSGPAPVPVQATHRHPYLYFSAADVPALREKFQHEPFASRWKTLLANADLAVANGPVSAPDMRDALGSAGTAAFAYAISGERKYGDHAVAQALTLLEADSWHVSRRWAANLETGEASTACALVYDWCYDLLTAEQRTTFRERLLTLSTRLYLKSVKAPKPDFWVNNVITNWSGVVSGGCGLGALAIYDESPEAQEAVGLAWQQVQAFQRGVTHTDGGGDEGVMYWRYGTQFSHFFLAAAARFFDADGGLYADATAKATGYWDIYMQGPDGQYANFNDMHENTYVGLYSKGGRFEAGPESTLCALYESKVEGGDAALLWGTDNGGANFYWRGASPFWFLWRRDVPPAQGDRPAIGDAVLFRGNGHALVQSPTLWLAYNGGWTSPLSHANMDLGSFMLCVNGERLVSDPGYGKVETAEHSSVLVSGKGQPKGVRGKYLAFCSGQNHHYLSTDLSVCYGDALTRFIRQILMVDGRFLVFVDCLAAPGAPEFEWRLQTGAAIEVAPDGKSARLNGAKAGMTVMSVAPADTQVTQGQATLPFLRIVPTEKAPETVLITVLYPTASAPDAPQPHTVFDPVALTLTVTDGAKSDTIRFARTGSDLVPKTVDGENVRPSLPTQRTFQVYRKK